MPKVNPLKPLLRDFPAATRAFLLAVSITLVLTFVMRVTFHSNKPGVFLLGDSGIGNYRLDPGQRLQDFLERSNPKTEVDNWAEPGATPMDFFLQYSRGCALAGKPRTAIIAFSPDKFLEAPDFHRFDDGGVNLRWLPWNSTGLKLFSRLTGKERNAAIVQQASMPLYAAADLGKSLWIRYVQWPWERSQMLTPSGERKKRIEMKSIESGKAKDTLKLIGDDAFAELPLAKDCEFLLRSLREQGVETRVILLPIGNPKLIRLTYSNHAQANQDSVKARMRHWLDVQGQSYVDFNAPGEMDHFPDSTWDDMSHLKSPSAFAYMSRRIQEFLRSAAVRDVQMPYSLVNSSGEDGNADARN